MKPILLVTLLFVAGCASVPPSDNGDSASSGGASYRAQVHTELGAGYYARGQYAVALNEVNTALSAEPDYAPAYNVLALIRAELREDKQAEEAFHRALSLQPQYSDAQNNYGYFLCKRGRIDESLPHFAAALANPLYATPETALVNAGACSLKKGDVAAAASFFLRAFKRAPRMSNAIMGVAEADYRQGLLLAARNKLRQLDDIGKLDAQALWLGVRVEHALGDQAAEASYGAQLRRRYPEAMQTQWLIMGQYDQNGDLL